MYKEKILIEAMHGLGDTVCILPMIQSVRQAFPDAELTVLTKFSAGKEILIASGIQIEHIIILDIYKNIFDSIQVIKSLRAMRFDVGISSAITPVRKAHWFMKLVHPKRWYGIQKSGLFFDLLKDQYHFVEANLLAVQEICKIPEEKTYPHLFVKAKDVQHIQERLTLDKTGVIVGVCVGEGDACLKNRIFRTGKVYTRGWGTENIINLIKVLQEMPVNVALIGGKQEMPIVERIKCMFPGMPHINDFVGKTTIGESMALASLCDCVIGIDTGMQHIAAAVGTKTISIFGPTNPKTHGAYSTNSVFVEARGVCNQQYCYGTPLYVNCKHRICLERVTIPQVLCEMKKMGVINED